MRKQRLKRALKVLKRAKGAVFIIADDLRYPVTKKAVRQMYADRLPANTVTREALRVMHNNLVLKAFGDIAVRGLTVRRGGSTE